MKIFDIVYVMTNGNFNTNVVGNEFFNQLFTNFNNGAAAAIVVMLMIAVIPVMFYQVRHFKAEEARHEPGNRHASAAADRRHAKKRRKATSFDANPAKAGWLTKLVLVLICFLWIVPVVGTFVTSFRTVDDAEHARAGGRSSARLASLTLDNYNEALDGGRHGRGLHNSFAITLPATFIPILIAAFAAYAFTFMEFPGRDFLFLAIVSLLVVPNYVAFVPMLKIYGNARAERHVPGGLAGPHRLRHVAGDLHPAQLHGDPAQDGHRVGEDRRCQPLPDLLPAGAADVGAGAGVVRDLPVPVGLERPAGGAGVHRTRRERADHRQRSASLRASSGQGWNLTTAGGFITMVVPIAGLPAAAALTSSAA